MAGDNSDTGSSTSSSGLSVRPPVGFVSTATQYATIDRFPLPRPAAHPPPRLDQLLRPPRIRQLRRHEVVELQLRPRRHHDRRHRVERLRVDLPRQRFSIKERLLQRRDWGLGVGG